ncbi:hypothetical protein GEV33_003836 [Tenebrio molitor]|uniref:Uncharacterized protein n=1 Tax=Tenebrio molitor TaxID=7067 RepID=A0A8J6HQL9_TENMO|nr:hypothetical protein GEV33_003836 [Tenebrio molitor]
MAIGRSRRPRGPTYARGANRSQFEDPELAVNARHLATRRAHPAFKFLRRSFRKRRVLVSAISWFFQFSTVVRLCIKQAQHALTNNGIRSRIARVTIFAIYGTAVPRLKMRKSDTSSRAVEATPAKRISEFVVE